ncbi:hypothetical protein ACFFR3_34660 [Nonomuraea salmonea]|uniref:Uncharacterized protein n=1 Tax=Nonomuraea salmonea TaxID=46181 RepID=A0ABV5NWQ0_9ACTN
MSRFEVATLVLAPLPVVFDASLSVELHASSIPDGSPWAIRSGGERGTSASSGT